MKSSYDVVIVGGGVIGCAVAYYLSRGKNLSIALIDIKKQGNATCASAGGLWPIGESVGLGCGVIFFKTFSKQMQQKKTSPSHAPDRPPMLPEFFFDFCLKSNESYPSLWQELKENYGMDFKFEKTGLKFIIYDRYDKEYAEQIAGGIKKLSHHIRWLDQRELREEEPFVSKEAIGALMFVNDHQLNPFLLMNAYREAARCNGVDLFLETEVKNISVKGNKVVSVSTTDQTFSCQTVINAAGAWASGIAKMVMGTEIPVKPIKGQILLSEKLPGLMHSCISTSDCYIAQKDNGEVLIGSTTEDKGFDTANTLDKLSELGAGAIRCLPYLKKANVKRSWVGLRPESPDEIPILGPVSGIDGYLNACGHFRTGILTSAITGKILCALVNDEQPPVKMKPFLMDRFHQFETFCKN